MREYQLDLAANAEEGRVVLGSFVRVKSATGAVQIRAYDDRGDIVDIELIQGQKVILPRVMRGIRVTDNSGAANAVVLVVGAGDIDDAQIVGVVEVVDSSYRNTARKIAFQGSVRSVALAGNYSHVQLWNPAASGVRLVVSTIYLDAAAAGGSIYVGEYAAQVLNMSLTPSNVYLGAAVSSAEIREERAVAALGYYGFGAVEAPLGESVFVRLDNPFLIDPGNGLVLRGAVNQAVRAGFMFVEEGL